MHASVDRVGGGVGVGGLEHKFWKMSNTDGSVILPNVLFIQFPQIQVMYTKGAEETQDGVFLLDMFLK